MIIKGLGDVANLAPSHYTTEYPKLMEFMEMYFRVSHEQGADYSHEYFLKQLQLVREREGDSTKVMDVAVDAWYDSLGMDLKANTSTAFDDVRFIKLLHHLYQIRGTMKCAEIFFSIFFGDNVEVRQSFPRDRMAVLDDNFILDGGIVTRDDDLYSEFSYEVTVFGVSVTDPRGARGTNEIVFDMMTGVDPRYNRQAVSFDDAENMLLGEVQFGELGEFNSINLVGFENTTVYNVNTRTLTYDRIAPSGIGFSDIPTYLDMVELTVDSTTTNTETMHLRDGNSGSAPLLASFVDVVGTNTITRVIDLGQTRTSTDVYYRCVNPTIGDTHRFVRVRFYSSTEERIPTANKETFDSVHALYMKTLHPSGFKAHITRT